MTVTKLKQKSYDKLSKTRYLKKLEKTGGGVPGVGVPNSGSGGDSSDIDIESDDSSSSGNSQNLTKYFESKYNKRSLLSILNEGPQVIFNESVIETASSVISGGVVVLTPQSQLCDRVEEHEQIIRSPQVLEGDEEFNGGDGSGNSSQIFTNNINNSMEIDEDPLEDDPSYDFSGDSVPEPESDDVLFCGHHVGKVLLSEFDGTTVLCRVCGDKASGFHYGVHSCEGCKGFFRRSIQQKIQYRPCTKNQQCSILRVNRNRCQYCRLKKCIAVGMSRDAVRFGRVPKREKAKILAAMQQSCNAKANERALSSELEDINKLTTNIIRAHMETCEFTKEKVQKCYQNALLKKQQDQNKGAASRFDGSSMTLACPLNPHPQSTTEDFSERFSPAIRGVVEFAKRLPGFSLLSQDDQVTLLKAGVFEILLVRLACMFQGNTMLCINGELLERETVSAHQNARFLLDSMFKFAEQFNKLALSDEQIGLFCAMVVLAPDRHGLRNVELVQRLQSHSRSALHSLVPSFVIQELDRKIPDLRTLNTLHSEKLMAFKMEEQQNLLSGGDSHHQQAMQLSPVSIASSHRSSSSVDSLDSFHTGTMSHSSGSSCNDNDLPIPSPRRLSTSASCPYKFPRALESPSGDSGIESGACSSPARSEQDIPILPHTPNSSHQDDQIMPVLKRALQAPPLLDTNLLMSEAYRPHKKFRYSVSEKSHSGSPPPQMMSQQHSPGPQQPHQQQQTSQSYPQSYVHQSRSNTSTPSTGPTPPPHQLYPQLASALTQPRVSNTCPSQQSLGKMMGPSSFKSPLQLQHSTLAGRLNEKPKLLTDDHAVTSDLLHSIIMRNGSGESSSSSPRHYPSMETGENPSASADNQVPLNLSTKIQIC